MKSQHASVTGPILLGTANDGDRRSPWWLLAAGLVAAAITLSLVFLFDRLGGSSGSETATSAEAAAVPVASGGEASGAADDAGASNEQGELPELAAVGVSPSNIALAPGDRLTLTLRATLETGSPAPATRLVGAFWESSDTEVVSVGPDGALRAESFGEAVVTVRLGEYSASAAVTVGDQALKTLGPPGPPTQVAVWQHGAEVMIRWEAAAVVAPAAVLSPSEPVAEVLGSEVRIVGTAQVRSRGKATTLAWPDLVAGERYTFEVRSHNEFGWGDWSLPSRALVVAEVEKPTALAAPVLVAGPGSATASWSAFAEASSYSVELDADGDGIADVSAEPTASPHTFAGLVPGAAVSARVVACTPAGCGPQSPWSAAVVTGALPATTTTVTTLAPPTTAVPTTAPVTSVPSSATTVVATTLPLTTSVVPTTPKPTTSRSTTSKPTVPTTRPTTTPAPIPTSAAIPITFPPEDER